MTKTIFDVVEIVGFFNSINRIADALGVELEGFLDTAEFATSTSSWRLVKVKMSTEPNLEDYLSAVIKEGLYPNRGNLQFHLKTLFKDIVLENRRVLDIGGGSGLHSFYTACMGAKEVVCLEPETEGSRSGRGAKFRRLSGILGQDQVWLSPLHFKPLIPQESNSILSCCTTQ